ncbi:MAG TPA: glycosyltransferase family A protein [Gaiellaceae bacterium]|nr:glycosyltransferase family A protein [Gaiellaceae bacterium]
MRLVAPRVPDDVQPGRRPTFSVLVAVHNGAAVVGDALASALAQTVRPLEVIVCDDGSTDELAAALEPFANEIVVLRQPRGGEGAAKNTAARAASGDFVAILDADDVYLPRRIEALGELASQRPDLDILTTDAYLEAGGRVVRRCYDQTWQFDVVDQRRAILDRNFIFGLAAVRRTRLLGAGGFDELLRWATDWDCWLRLILDGAQAGLVDEPLARYRLSTTSLTAQRTQLYLGRVAVLEKASRSPQLTSGERTAVATSLRRERGHAAASAAVDALRTRAPGARRLALEAARSPHQRLARRIRFLAAAAAPKTAGRRLDHAAPTGAAGVAMPGDEAANAPTPAGEAPR